MIKDQGSYRSERNGAAPESHLRITDISTRIVHAELRNWIFVRVETNEPGLYGWGEATLEWKTRAVAGTLEDLKPLLLNKDPRDIEHLVRMLKKQSFWKLGTIGMTAIAGIEIALWDILGKYLDQPVWRLLGGKVRDRVKVYTHLGMGDMHSVYETTEAGPLNERAAAVVECGYKALKVILIPYTHYTVTPTEVDRVGRLMDGLRSTVGANVEIIVDFHGRPASAGAALAYMDALLPGRPMFVEEALPPGATRALAQLNAKSHIPIACGERLVDRIEFDDLFRVRAIDIAQPDICHCGGLLETKKIAAMAETASIGIAPHNPLGPIASVAALHFAISTPNHVIQEEMVGAVPWFEEVVRSPIRMIDGHWMLPEASGLGVEVDEAACARHPFAPEVLHTMNAVLPDGTVVDW